MPRIAGTTGIAAVTTVLEAVLGAASDSHATDVVVVFGGADDSTRALVAELRESATLVLNMDDAAASSLAGLTVARVVGSGISDAAELRAESVDATASGTSFVLVHGAERHDVRLRMLGEQQVALALVAIAAGLELGVDIADAIARAGAVETSARWSMQVQRAANGVTVINDAAEATPDTMASALKALAQFTTDGTRSVAVLGELSDVGEDSRDEHDRIGRLVVRLNIKKLVVVGQDARHIHNAAGLEGSWDGESVLVDTQEEAYDLLCDEIREGDMVLVKSSEAAGLRHLGDRLGGVDA